MTDIPTYHRGDRNFGTGYDMMKQIEALEDEIERLRSTPMVKPLVWEDRNHYEVAKSPVGDYEVGWEDGAWAQCDGPSMWEWSSGEDHRGLTIYDAKAAAQADYERRVRAALTQEGKG